MVPYSAYIPCFNNSATLAAALLSLQAQDPPPSQFFLVDDGSSDDSRLIAYQHDLPVVSMHANCGRGAVRARAIELSENELVACCDATNYLPHDYVARALHWFSDPMVAAVCGPISQQSASTLADRWRGRHLFKIASVGSFHNFSVQHYSALSTYGCVVRASAVRQVGNFNPTLRHSEDADLGRRLLSAGYDIIFDPRLCVFSAISNSIPELLERYWRWNAGPYEDVTLIGYAKQVWFSLRVMVVLDLRDGDFLSIFLSLFCPHYQFWRSWWRQRAGRVQG